MLVAWLKTSGTKVRKKILSILEQLPVQCSSIHLLSTYYMSDRMIGGGIESCYNAKQYSPPFMGFTFFWVETDH